MAYGRYARRYRTVRRRRPGYRTTRRVPRRTTSRYRRTRTVTRKPRLLTKRGILDATAKKKRDNMLTFTNINIPRTDLTYRAGAAALQGGGSPYHFLFAASARNKEDELGGGVTVDDESTRASSLIFAKGYRERVGIQTLSALPWTWRRIVFTMKGTDSFFNPAGSSAPGQFVQTSNGYARLINQMGANQLIGLHNMIFDGASGADWTSPLTAKVDSSIATILSDKTIIVRPQTSAGAIQNMRFYYPLEKNIQYFEDESGGETTKSAWSTVSKQGMGDLLIYDMFYPRDGSAFADQLSLDIQATFYWHEK